MIASSSPSRCDSRLTSTLAVYCPTIFALLITELTCARIRLEMCARTPLSAAWAPRTPLQGQASTTTSIGLLRAPMPSAPAPV